MGCGNSSAIKENQSLVFNITTPSIYRGTLSHQEQELYDFILDGYKSYSLFLDCLMYTAARSRKSANRVNQAVLLDHPEIFHTFVESISTEQGKCTLTFAAFNPEVVSSKAQQIMETINLYFKPYYHSQEVAGRTETDLAKIQVVIEWLLSYGRYEVLPDTDMSQFTIEGFFLKRRSSCEGFAKAYQLLCSMIGIQVTCVRGDYSINDAVVDVSVFSAYPKEVSPRTVFSTHGIDKFNVINDVTHQYDHIYGEQDAMALDLVQKQHSEGILAGSTNTNMTLSSIHRPDSLGGHRYTGHLTNREENGSGESLTGIAVSAEDGEVINKKVVTTGKGNKKRFETIVEEEITPKSDLSLSASQVLKPSTQTQIGRDVEMTTTASGPLGNSNVISLPSKSANRRHTWSMTKIDGTWYHTDVILCLRGMVDAYIPSAFLRMSTSIIMKMGLNMMSLIKPFSVDTPIFGKNTCILRSEKSIVGDIVSFLLTKIAELQNTHQIHPLEPGSTASRAGPSSSASGYPLWAQNSAGISIYGATMDHSRSAVGGGHASWTQMAMSIGGAMPYNPVPPNMDNNNKSISEDRRQQSCEEPNTQENYEQWRKSRLMALQTAFINESLPPSMHIAKQSSQLSAQEAPLVQPSQSYADDDQSLFSSTWMRPVSQATYQPQNPVKPHDILSSLDPVLTFEFVYEINLDWSVARRIVKGKMPFISSQLATKGYRVSNYTVEKFLTTIVIEQRPAE
ncbi:Hypothetical protein GLP15_3711 [Giardia lamblia P15]|uniref:Transglutaminase-like domain-containing protein n=1 Tax=Giardia intestinalis (strain P15) TaxID=658858 RepID=E1F5U4_GIAIA|nr:Hypothetical protein GLP15_3711 [Giardia lamblia P15]